jgi:flagellar hook assembly protein FlgD
MVWVRVYNLAGELVRTPFQAPLAAGVSFQTSWDGRNDAGDWVGSGVYFVSVKGSGFRSVRKVVLLK